ncbi:hypothetical protein Tco_0810979 [Tanacetum coccineum]
MVTYTTVPATEDSPETQEMWESPIERSLLSTPKHHKSYAPTSKASLPTRSHAATRYKGKDIAKPITPPSESASEEDSDPEQAQKDNDMQKKFLLSLHKVLSRNSTNLPTLPQNFSQYPKKRMYGYKSKIQD